jgi:hypothetical protein
MFFQDAIEDRYEWRESAKGNHVCIFEGTLVATVWKHEKGEVWQIILNREDLYGFRTGYAVVDEYFFDLDEAMDRTIDILEGEDCTLSKLPGR